MTEVFPINNYYLNLAVTLKPIAYPLLLLFFFISFVLFALDAFERTHLEDRVREFIVTGILISVWPVLVVSLKGAVDAFNFVLVHDVFRMNWNQGIGGGALDQIVQGLKLG